MAAIGRGGLVQSQELATPSRVICCYFPRCVSREQDQKQEDQDSNVCPNGMSVPQAVT